MAECEATPPRADDPETGEILSIMDLHQLPQPLQTLDSVDKCTRSG